MTHKTPQQSDVSKRLFQAGIDAIEVGTEDFDHADARRRIAAIRNLYSGILLLCKHLLVTVAPEESPTLFISARIGFRKDDETGEIVPFAEDSRKTINSTQVMERMASLGIAPDFSEFKRLRTIRNDLEHFYSNETEQALQRAFSAAQLLVHDLLARSTITHDLGSKWRSLVAKSEAYQRRQKKSQVALARIDWISDTVREAMTRLDELYFEGCENCGATHLEPIDDETEQCDVSLKCMACGEEMEMAQFVSTIVEASLGGSDFEAAKQGEPPSVYECPSCNSDAYISFEEKCSVCGYCEEEETCTWCGDPLGIQHVSNGDEYHDDCAYWAYAASKDD